MSHGVDVNKNRLDDLDRIILQDSLSEPFSKKNICNIGCGESTLSIALCSLGHFVYNYDRRDLSSFFSMTKELFSKQKFTQIHIEEIKNHHLPKAVDSIVLQRVLHYMSYRDTVRFLNRITATLSEGGKMYISLTGLDSQIARGYDVKNAPIESRMGNIAEQEQQDFNISEPVCLYSLGEAQSLIESIEGIRIERIWVSQFGNIKIVTSK